MKDRSETEAEVAWENSFNAEISIFFLSKSSSLAKLRMGLSTSVPTGQSEENTDNQMNVFKAPEFRLIQFF